MNRKTSELLTLISDNIRSQTNNESRVNFWEGVSISLTISREGAKGIDYKTSIEGYEDRFGKLFIKPSFRLIGAYEAMNRKAQTIVGEAYIYYTSQGNKCSVENMGSLSL